MEDTNNRMAKNRWRSHYSIDWREGLLIRNSDRERSQWKETIDLLINSWEGRGVISKWLREPPDIITLSLSVWEFVEFIRENKKCYQREKGKGRHRGQRRKCFFVIVRREKKSKWDVLNYKKKPPLSHSFLSFITPFLLPMAEPSNQPVRVVFNPSRDATLDC